MRLEPEVLRVLTGVLLCDRRFDSSEIPVLPYLAYGSPHINLVGIWHLKRT